MESSSKICGILDRNVKNTMSLYSVPRTVASDGHEVQSEKVHINSVYWNVRLVLQNAQEINDLIYAYIKHTVIYFCTHPR
jgi:hypothetical protein